MELLDILGGMENLLWWFSLSLAVVFMDLCRRRKVFASSFDIRQKYSDIGAITVGWPNRLSME